MYRHETLPEIAGWSSTGRLLGDETEICSFSAQPTDRTRNPHMEHGLELVYRDLDVCLTIVLSWWKFARAHVYLHRWKDELRHSKLSITRHADAHELVFVCSVTHMHVVQTLGCDRGLPLEFAASGRLIIVAEKQSGPTGKR